MGAIAVKILLDNKKKWDGFFGEKKKPLLVVAYTNHALDQFLNHILKFTPSIVRVGGRSSDETMKKYTLMEYRKQEHWLNDIKRLHETIDKLNKLKQKIFHTHLSSEKIIHNLHHRKRRISELNSILSLNGYDFAEPISFETTKRIFKIWREKENIDKKTLKEMVRQEITDGNELNKELSESENETVDAPEIKEDWIKSLKSRIKEENSLMNKFNVNKFHKGIIENKEIDFLDLDKKRKIEE